MNDQLDIEAVPENISAMRKGFMRQDEFDDLYIFYPPPAVNNKLKKVLKKILHPCLHIKNFLAFLASFLPALEWLSKYKFKSYLLGDFIAGITIGIVHVPQGIAYSSLMGIDPVYGLYSSFFPVLFYMFFGTSRHASIGSFAIISLMTGISRTKIMDAIYEKHLQNEAHYIENAVVMGQSSLDLHNLTASVPFILKGLSGIQIITTLTFCIGIIHIIMGILRVEFLASYLSDQLISGFSTGASVHVLIVQLDKIFQVKVDSRNGPGMMLVRLFDVMLEVKNCSRAPVIISLCAFVFLFIGKDLINPRLAKKIPTPLPFEIILVVITVICSHVLQLESSYGVKVVGEIPAGLPRAQLPQPELFPYVFEDAIEIAVVIVAVHLSMCKIFSRRHNYKTDNNQELYAIGLTGAISSFFSTYPVCSAIGRSTVNSESGCKTQLSGFFAASLVLLVILWLGPLLEPLPMCVLAVIIIFSLKNVFCKKNEVMELWNVSKCDFAIWTVSFLSTVTTDVMWGLTISVVFALLTIIFRTQWPRWRILARLTGTDDYLDCGRYGRVTDIATIRVFRFDAPLLFTNVDHFRNAIEKATIDCSTTCLATLDHILESDTISEARKLQQMKLRRSLKRTLSEYSDDPAKRVGHLVIDCSGFTFVDYMSIRSLLEIFKKMEANNIQIYFAGTKAHIRDMFEKYGFYKHVSRDHFYPTIHDAVESARMNEEIQHYKRFSKKKKLMMVTKNLDSNSDYEMDNYLTGLTRVSVSSDSQEESVQAVSLNGAALAALTLNEQVEQVWRNSNNINF